MTTSMKAFLRSHAKHVVLTAAFHHAGVGGMSDGGGGAAAGAASAKSLHENNILSSNNPDANLSLDGGRHNALVFLESAFAVTAPKIFTFIVVLMFGMVFTAIAPPHIDEILRRFGAHDHHRALTEYLLYIVMFLSALALAMASVGLEPSEIVRNFSVISITLSIALGAVVGNVISGIVLQLNGIARIGHRINVGGFEGTVFHTNLSFVFIRRESGAMSFMPNIWIASMPGDYDLPPPIATRPQSPLSNEEHALNELVLDARKQN